MANRPNDWEPVILRKKPPNPSQAKSAKAINEAQRKGEAIETTKKFAAGSNKHFQTSLNTAKLDRETEELKLPSLGLDVGKIIQKARNDKAMTQKDLATKICEKPQVVNEYECGKGVPNQQVLAKMERVLGVKLRGKDKGQPLAPPSKK